MHARRVHASDVLILYHTRPSRLPRIRMRRGLTSPIPCTLYTLYMVPTGTIKPGVRMYKFKRATRTATPPLTLKAVLRPLNTSLRLYCLGFLDSAQIYHYLRYLAYLLAWCIFPLNTKL